MAANSGDIVTHGELEISVMMTTLSLGSIDRKKGLEASQVLTYLVSYAHPWTGLKLHLLCRFHDIFTAISFEMHEGETIY